MSDEVRGPAMIAATSMLRPPPARIGKLSDRLVLPRSVEVKKAAATAIGAVVGLFLWGLVVGLIFGYSFETFLVTVFFCGALGLAFVSVSPLRGESMAKWIELMVASRSGTTVNLGGKEVHAYLGIAPLPFVASGNVRMLPGAVDVLPGNYDDRGVPVPNADVRRSKLDAHGHPGSAPAVWEGFDPVRSLSAFGEDAVTGAETAPKGQLPPSEGAAPFFPTTSGAAPSMPAAVAPQYEDPFAQPAKKLPKK